MQKDPRHVEELAPLKQLRDSSEIRPQNEIGLGREPELDVTFIQIEKTCKSSYTFLSQSFLMLDLHYLESG